MLCLRRRTQPSAAYRPGTEGSPQTGPPSRAAHHHEVGPIAAALRAAKPQLGQRHVTAPRLHESLQIGVRLVAARVADHQHAHVAGSSRGACCRQAVIVRSPVARPKGHALPGWTGTAAADVLGDGGQLHVILTASPTNGNNRQRSETTSSAGLAHPPFSTSSGALVSLTGASDTPVLLPARPAGRSAALAGC